MVWSSAATTGRSHPASNIILSATGASLEPVLRAMHDWASTHCESE